MPVSATLRESSLVEILRALVNTKQTGYLKLREGEHEGFLAVENGTIINARTGSYTAVHALFQFVSWREAKMEFHERPMAIDLTRDLAVYDPQVLIIGLSAKVEELATARRASLPFDSVLNYTGGAEKISVEASAADLGLLTLANGRRTVREIAVMVKQNPLEVARSLGRFRSAGVLELVAPEKGSKKSAMAEAG